MKKVKVRETVEYELVVPDDWEGKTFYGIHAPRDTEDKEFCNRYYTGNIYSVEDYENLVDDIYEGTSTPHNIQTIDYKIVDEQ